MTRKVLVIDDDPTLRALVALHLVNAGYEVLEAADAVEGGYRVLERSPDLIICDVNMPFMDGYQFVTVLKADPETSHIPVVFLTVDDEVADQARQLGAAAYLRKPVTADRLLAVVGLFIAPAIAG